MTDFKPGLMQYNSDHMRSTARHIILASASSRRLEILRAHGIEPEVIVSDVDERSLLAALPSTMPADELVRLMAIHKAQAVYRYLLKQARVHPSGSGLILAADTVVSKDGVGLLGKPANRAEAVRMLQALCNCAHQVFTGVAAIDVVSGAEDSLVDITTVHFGSYGLQEIEDYLAAEPPYDKAGSYAIQGIWKQHLTQIEGDLENVIGLPYYRLAELSCW